MLPRVVALPRGTRVSSKINSLEKGLGKTRCTQIQWGSGLPPKPSSTPAPRRAPSPRPQRGRALDEDQRSPLSPSSADLNGAHCCSPQAPPARCYHRARSATVSNDENVRGWMVMLVPFSFIDGTDETTGEPRATVELHPRRAARSVRKRGRAKNLLPVAAETVMAPARAPPRRHVRAGPVAAQTETRRRERRDDHHAPHDRRTEAGHARATAAPTGSRHEAAVEEIADRKGRRSPP